MDLEKLKKFTALRAVPDQLLYSLLIWPDHSIPASYGPVCVCVCVVDVCIRKFGSSSPSWLDVQSSSFSIQQCDGYPSNIIPIPFHPAVMGNRHLLGGQILLTMSHPSAERHGQASCAFLAWLQEVHYYNISGHVY